MITLNALKIRNFRNIKEVDIDFSIDESKPLTIIRAENGVGKTTLLLALRWVLFGDFANPANTTRKKKQLTKAPASWDIENNGPDIPVEVELWLTAHSGNGDIEYHVVRSQTVRVSESDRIGQDQEAVVKVLRKTNAGFKTEDYPELAIARDLMSPSLMEFFFIDGDDAYNFVTTSDASDRSEKVEQAIKLLLQLDLLESSVRHLKESKKNVTKNIGLLGKGTEMEEVSKQISAIDQDIDAKKEEIDASGESLKTLRQNIQDNEKSRDAILSQGGEDKDLLRGQLSKAVDSHDEAKSAIDRITLGLRDQINSADLLFLLTQKTLKTGLSMFSELKKQKKIPNTLHEILALTLRDAICICGADVSPGTAGHKHIEDAIALTKHQTPAHIALMNLSQIADVKLRSGVDGQTKWLGETQSRYQDLVTAKRRQLESKQAQVDLERKIKNAPDTGLKVLQEAIEKLRDDADGVSRALGRSESDLALLENRKQGLELRKRELSKNQAKYRAAMAEEMAASSMIDVFERTLETFKTEKVQLVSQLMNEYFLRMINQDPENGSTGTLPIKNVSLTESFDIVATLGFGAISPSSQLNGASRRALTAAYLIALAKVSGEKSTVVMDTPLGMTSGQIRRSFVTELLSEARQSVLIMTSNEIVGIEDILQSKAGKIFELIFDQDNLTVSQPLKEIS
jgi:DNA sulfur modification protein DndD